MQGNTGRMCESKDVYRARTTGGDPVHQHQDLLDGAIRQVANGLNLHDIDPQGKPAQLRWCDKASVGEKVVGGNSTSRRGCA